MIETCKRLEQHFCGSLMFLSIDKFLYLVCMWLYYNYRIALLLWKWISNSFTVLLDALSIKLSLQGFYSGLGTGQIDQVQQRFCSPGLAIWRKVFHIKKFSSESFFSCENQLPRNFCLFLNFSFIVSYCLPCNWYLLTNYNWISKQLWRDCCTLIGDFHLRSNHGTYQQYWYSF